MGELTTKPFLWDVSTVSLWINIAMPLASSCSVKLSKISGGASSNEVAALSGRKDGSVCVNVTSFAHLGPGYVQMRFELTGGTRLYVRC